MGFFSSNAKHFGFRVKGLGFQTQGAHALTKTRVAPWRRSAARDVWWNSTGASSIIHSDLGKACRVPGLDYVEKFILSCNRLDGIISKITTYPYYGN